MGQDVVGANELKAPLKRVENVSLLCHELVVSKWRLDVLEQLRDARVGLLVVLGRDEDASYSNQRQHIALCLSTEVWNGSDVVNNVRSLQIGVQCVDGVVEGFRLMVELAAQRAHPVDVKLSVAHVKGLWVVELAEVLAFDESVEDAVHWDFSLEVLVRTSQALDNCVLLLLQICSIAHLLSKLGGGQVLEAAADCAVTKAG